MKKLIKHFLIITLFFVSGCLVNAQEKAFNSNNMPVPSQNQNKNSVQAQSYNAVPNVRPIQQDSTKNIELSSIEKLFSSDIDKSELKQVGYDFFSNITSQGFGRYDSSYKLNIGEKIDVYFWGDSVDMLSISGSQMLSPLTKSQVDTKGNIFVPGVGIVKAEGRNISDVERDIQSLAGQKFTNVKVRITVADSAEFVIFVYGAVKKPGKVNVGNNSSIIEALAAAGGVSKNGSLRNITYKSSGKSRKADLYEVIFKGKDSDIRLKPNDTIFVNNLGSVVAVKNGVKNPGIYESAPNDSLADIINYAGGFLPSTDKSIINIKAYSQKDGQRISMDIPSGLFKKTQVTNGDILEFRSLYGKAEDFVSLEGNVKRPGVFAYKKGMKLSDILKDKNDLQNETFICQAVIKRISGDSKQIISIPVSLEDFFNGGNNPLLKPQDTITVYKNTNSDFIEVYGCINKPKQIPYNDKLTLKDVMAGIHFIASKPSETNIHDISTISSNNTLIPAYDIAVEITNESNYIDYNDNQPSNISDSNNNNNDSKGLNKNNFNNKISNNKVLDNNKMINIRTYYLYDILVRNDSLEDIKVLPGDKILFRTLRDNEIVKTIKISGYVNKPGVYDFVEGKRLSDMIEIAGGLTKDANLRGIVYKRTCLAQQQQEAVNVQNEKDMKQIKGQMAGDTNAAKDDTEARQATLNEISAENNNLKNKFEGRIALDIKSNDLTKLSDAENIEIQDGDEIYIPKFSNHVTVIGEVYNETSFIYKKGAKASYYIKLVGGYMPNARKTKLYKISVNGRASRLNLCRSNSIEPGDTIVVPRKIRGNDWVQPLASALQAVASLLTSVFIVTKL